MDVKNTIKNINNTSSHPINSMLNKKEKISSIEVVFHAMQKEAKPEQIFKLQRYSNTEYYFLPTIEQQKIPCCHGTYTFVILETNPTEIYCSATIRSDYKHPEDLIVEGHTSISRCKDVLYAGELHFEEGTLIKWTNESGHYKPTKTHNEKNLTAPVQILLPTELYQEAEIQ